MNSEGAPSGAEFQSWHQVMSVLEKTVRDGDEELYARPRFPFPVPVEGVSEMIGDVLTVEEGFGLLSRVVGLAPAPLMVVLMMVPTPLPLPPLCVAIAWATMTGAVVVRAIGLTPCW